MTYTHKKYGFYRPHAPVNADDLVLDPKTGKSSKMPSMARQEFKDQCDINNILKQFKRTGIIAHISAQAQKGSYEDLPDPMEYQDAVNAVLAGQEAFATLPSKVRSRFENDPEQFLRFMADPDNRTEAEELGLLLPKPPPDSNSGGEATSNTSSDTKTA